MSRSVPIASPVIDLKMKHRAYQKHIETLQNIKPSIDTSNPGICPRILLYRQRVTNERLLQLQIDNENVKMIKQTEKEHDNLRKSMGINFTPGKTRRMINWMEYLPEQEAELGMDQTKTDHNSPGRSLFGHDSKRPQTTASVRRPPPISPKLSKPVPSTKKKVIHEDGMTVVDDQVKAKPQMVRPFHPTQRVSKTAVKLNRKKLEPLEADDIYSPSQRTPKEVYC